MEKNINSGFDELTSLISKNKKYLNEKINDILKLFFNTIKKNRTIFWAGNGGSAAESQHMSAELIGRFKFNRKPVSSIALSADISSTTAISNDYGFENIFSRQLDGLGRAGDLLIVMSTSGNSKNIIKVLKVAKSKGIKSIAFLGNDGGKCKSYSDLSLIIKSKNTARIQEMHQIISHIICENVENQMLND